VFEGQCQIALCNLETIHAAVGDKVDVVFLTGTDFGAQNGPFISPKTYRDLYQPFHKEINRWVHKNTTWKTFIHSCGSVYKLIPDFIESGFDILNPVQTSAAEMNPDRLKNEFGRDIVFWGGGIDTQKTLPFGTPDEIRQQVKARMQVFGQDGGFVFNSIHNIQAGVPQENLLALFEAVEEFR
jgi:uroporphyrinogen-III decarboxylase